MRQLLHKTFKRLLNLNNLDQNKSITKTFFSYNNKIEKNPT